MRKIILLGASGSIGVQTLDVIESHPESLKLVGASVGERVEVLKDILSKHPLDYACLKRKDEELEKQYPNTTFFYGDEGLKQMANVQDYDLLVNSLVGFLGFIPTMEAINNHKDVALANKETIVVGGDLVYKALKQNNVNLYPIDSEHSAIDQCLNGNRHKDVERLIITASGGAFKNVPYDELNNMKAYDALKHPTWNMGSKITIDSATMMNKGFEVIEAHYLFDIPSERIDVLIHPESIVHSMVEFKDHSILAQLSYPDMRIPIQYALLRNHDELNIVKPLDLASVQSLNFSKPDYAKKHRLISVAKLVLKYKGNLGAILNASNDTAVNLYLNDKIKFLDIEKSILLSLKYMRYIANPTYQDIIDTYHKTCEFVSNLWSE